MSDTPRWYRWYPDKEYDLGTMPFEGDYTLSDRIYQMRPSGMWDPYVSNATGTEFGRSVQKKVGKRMMTVWEPGVSAVPMEISGVTYPIWFMYYGDGVCTVKIPNGQLEPVEPTET